MDGLYDGPLPYISAWHQAPVRVDRDLASLHLEVFSIKRAANKLKFLAGSESGDGRLHQRRRPRADRGDPARRAAAMTEADTGAQPSPTASAGADRLGARGGLVVARTGEPDR